MQDPRRNMLKTHAYKNRPESRKFVHTPLTQGLWIGSCARFMTGAHHGHRVGARAAGAGGQLVGADALDQAARVDLHGALLLAHAVCCARRIALVRVRRAHRVQPAHSTRLSSTHIRRCWYAYAARIVSSLRIRQGCHPPTFVDAGTRTRRASCPACAFDKVVIHPHSSMLVRVRRAHRVQPAHSTRLSSTHICRRWYAYAPRIVSSLRIRQGCHPPTFVDAGTRTPRASCPACAFDKVVIHPHLSTLVRVRAAHRVQPAHSKGLSSTHICRRWYAYAPRIVSSLRIRQGCHPPTFVDAGTRTPRASCPACAFDKVVIHPHLSTLVRVRAAHRVQPAHSKGLSSTHIRRCWYAYAARIVSSLRIRKGCHPPTFVGAGTRTPRASCPACASKQLMKTICIDAKAEPHLSTHSSILPPLRKHSRLVVGKSTKCMHANPAKHKTECRGA